MMKREMATETSMSRDQERQPESSVGVAGEECCAEAGSGEEGVEPGQSSLCCGSGTVKGLADGMGLGAARGELQLQA